MDIFNDKMTLESLSVNKPYWSKGSFEQRWQYMSVVISIIKSLGIENDILEIGTNGLPLSKISTQLELNSKNVCNENLIVHNLNDVPYPFQDKQFELSVALQVWEHLDDKLKSFKELKRISKNIILSFPYKWKNKKDLIHYNIDEDTISSWTDNEEYSSKEIIAGPMVKRIVYLWQDLN